jgi:membrane-associated phospholipid phosphatase
MLKVTAARASVDSRPARDASNRGWDERRLLAAAILLAALAASALMIDMRVAQAVKQRRLPGELRRVIRLSEVFGFGGTVALIIVTAAVLDGRGWRLIIRLAVPTYGAGALADGFKLLVARQRPSAANLSEPVLETFIDGLPTLHHEELGERYGYALQSFPSAHAATAAGLAAALAGLYPRGRWLFAGFAVLAGTQRIEAQAHFLSDVLAGAALGCLVAAACQAAWSRVGWDKAATAADGPPT